MTGNNFLYLIIEEMRRLIFLRCNNPPRWVKSHVIKCKELVIARRDFLKKEWNRING